MLMCTHSLPYCRQGGIQEIGLLFRSSRPCPSASELYHRLHSTRLDSPQKEEIDFWGINWCIASMILFVTMLQASSGLFLARHDLVRYYWYLRIGRYHICDRPSRKSTDVGKVDFGVMTKNTCKRSYSGMRILSDDSNVKKLTFSESSLNRNTVRI